MDHLDVTNSRQHSQGFLDFQKEVYEKKILPAINQDIDWNLAQRNRWLKINTLANLLGVLVISAAVSMFSFKEAAPYVGVGMGVIIGVQKLMEVSHKNLENYNRCLDVYSLTFSGNKHLNDFFEKTSISNLNLQDESKV